MLIDFILIMGFLAGGFAIGDIVVDMIMKYMEAKDD